MIAAISLRTAQGVEIVDEGPEAKDRAHGVPRKTRPAEVHGRVRQTLFAPKGEVCGGILESGEIVRMRPKENAALAAYFAPGAKIGVWGDAITVRGQTVIDLGEVAIDD